MATGTAISLVFCAAALVGPLPLFSQYSRAAEAAVLVSRSLPNVPQEFGYEVELRSNTASLKWHYPKVNTNASTPGSRNSISNARSTIGSGCRIS
jgi:hypothetical protein